MADEQREPQRHRVLMVFDGVDEERIGLRGLVTGFACVGEDGETTVQFACGGRTDAAARVLAGAKAGEFYDLTGETYLHDTEDGMKIDVFHVDEAVDMGHVDSVETMDEINFALMFMGAFGQDCGGELRLASMPVEGGAHAH